MKQENLVFDSVMLREGNRYPQGFALPDFPRDAQGNFCKEKAIALLKEEEYGVVDTQGVTMQVDVESVNKDMIAGKCDVTRFCFRFFKNGEEKNFPVEVFMPNYDANGKLVVFVDFSPVVPNRACPIEELMDRGIALAHFCFRDVTSDDNEFENGLAAFLCDRTKPDGAGKISVWAYAAQRVGHYLLDNGYVAAGNLYVAGHSRLGKTALWTAAQDEAFAGVLSNCSGCSGAAISRNKQGETIEDICRVFPFWFCQNYQKYIKNEDAQPFDQHYLTGLIAPRKLCVVTAERDEWADTEAQYLCVEAASKAYEELGLVGLQKDRALPKVRTAYRAGNIAFCFRRGTHFFSREDWNFYLDFILNKD